jgi:hypothetical protein
MRLALAVGGRMEEVWTIAVCGELISATSDAAMRGGASPRLAPERPAFGEIRRRRMSRVSQSGA